MVAIRRVAHFSIPVSDTAKSTKFYTEVVGCGHLSTTPNGQMVFPQRRLRSARRVTIRQRPHTIERRDVVVPQRALGIVGLADIPGARQTKS